MNLLICRISRYHLIVRKTLFLFIAVLITTIGFSQTLPMESSSLFSGSGNCQMCHSAEGTTLVSSTGADISPLSTWQSTMMANASKDPLWQAKVTAEVSAHPALQSVIEDKCTTCHAPLGRTEAIYHGAEAFAFSQVSADPLSLDGVSCTLCHQIQNENLGDDESFSGHYTITDAHEIFGPHPNPTTLPMFNQTSYTPVYAQHTNGSELCATCHTLFTPFVDDDGNVAGTFPEQTPYLEWQNSIYEEENIECQTCHMPAVDEAIKIASRPPWLDTKRQPVWKHDLVGGNSFMVSLLKENAQELGVHALQVNFDSTLAKEDHLLKNQSIELSADGFVENDSLTLTVHVKNLAGHKFPTGFPSRRAWLHVEIKNQDGETIFQSGAWDENGEILGLDEHYEPHHQLIVDQNQVQIYESIMQDVNGEVTFTLLRGADYIKDNRLPPIGFNRQADDYKHIAIKGAAAQDTDFSPDDKTTSGSDIVIYKIPAADSEYNVTVSMYYQTITPRFVDDLFKYNTQQVSTFKGVYESKPNTPILLKHIQKTIVSTKVGTNSIKTPTGFELKNFPNPFNSSTFFEFNLAAPSFVTIKIYDAAGRLTASLVQEKLKAGAHRIPWNGLSNSGHEASSGIYVAVVTTETDQHSVRTVLLQ